MINSFDTNIKETPCKFKIKATGEVVEGFKMQSSDNSINYLVNDKNYTHFISEEVEEIDTSRIDTMTDCTYSIIDPKTKKIIQEINEGGFEVKYKDGEVDYCQEGTLNFVPQDQVIDVVYK